MQQTALYSSGEVLDSAKPMTKEVPMFHILFAATIAHCIGDFPLQGDFLANMKGKFDYILFCHALIWTGCVCAVLGYFGVFAWWKAALLLVGHFAIDRWSSRKKDKTKALTSDLWIDQGLHFAQLLFVTVK
jgi:hypothetical protein